LGGVKVVFGFPGDGINGLFEALRTHQDKLQFIQVRHEEAAAFAACGYAKFTGSLGVCMATSGPGGVHLSARPAPDRRPHSSGGGRRLLRECVLDRLRRGHLPGTTAMEPVSEM
jgi:hypothetical protein